jgi:hypothetical protein
MNVNLWKKHWSSHKKQLSTRTRTCVGGKDDDYSLDDSYAVAESAAAAAAVAVHVRVVRIRRVVAKR